MEKEIYSADCFWNFYISYFLFVIRYFKMKKDQ